MISWLTRHTFLTALAASAVVAGVGAIYASVNFFALWAGVMLISMLWVHLGLKDIAKWRARKEKKHGN